MHVRYSSTRTCPSVRCRYWLNIIVLVHVFVWLIIAVLVLEYACTCTCTSTYTCTTTCKKTRFMHSTIVTFVGCARSAHCAGGCVVLSKGVQQACLFFKSHGGVKNLLVCIVNDGTRLQEPNAEEQGNAGAKACRNSSNRCTPGVLLYCSAHSAIVRNKR